MVSESPPPADPSLLHSLKLHLEGLKRTQHGQILYNQIQRGLQKYGHEDGRIEIVFVTFLYALLGKYAISPSCDPATRVKARLVQQRLTPYLPKNAPTPKPAAARAASPVAATANKSRPPVKSEDDSAAPSVPAPKPIVEAKPELSAPPSVEPEPAQVLETTATPPPEVASPAIVPEPTSRQEKIEVLEGVLAQQVTESLAVDKTFGELLREERQKLEQLESPLGEFNDLKKILVKGLDELIEERQTLIDKLSSASEYFKAVEADRDRLRQELSHARKHSLADELTGLPKRDVFVKQLEAEIGRVKRYGFALALALVDVDNLESVNKRYGRQAGDAVLRHYAGQILGKFRTYDLVARYGDDEFAVLFPNTQKDGAMHALEKARKNATSTFIQQDGKNIPLPSFSSVLTQYAPGEPASALLARADQTLSQAKLAGYNRLVVALPTA